MKFKIILVTLLSPFFVENQYCHRIDQPLCTVIYETNQDKIKRVINGYLSTLDNKADTNYNFKEIREWLASSPCILSAEIIDRIIETRPPIAQFRFHLTDEKLPGNNYILQITFDIDYKFYQLIKEDEQ